MIKIKLLAVVGLLLAQAANAATWTQIPTGTTKQLNCIEFASNDVGYIGGNDSLLLKTTDGGATWNEVSFTGINFFPGGEHIVNLDFVTEDIGFAAAGHYGAVYKTTDGGLTWTQFANPNGYLCFVQGMYFFNENLGLLGGSGCFSGEHFDMYDNGTWTSSTDIWTWNADNRITNIDFYNANYGLATSKSGLVLKTTDGGVSWDTIPSGLWDVSLEDVTIVNDTLAYIAYSENGIGVLHSTDGGDSWSIDNSSGTFLYPSFYAAHTTQVSTSYIGGQPSFGWQGVIFSHELGAQWWWQDNVDQVIYDIASYGDSIVFAVGDSGYVVTNVDPVTLGIGVTTTETRFDVYPNPSTDVVMLDVGAFEGKILQVKLYDLYGKLIYEDAFSVATNVTVDIAALPSGIYLLEVSDGIRQGSQRLVKVEH